MHCQLYRWQILGTFANLRRGNVSFIMSVRPPARNSAAATGQIFHEIWYVSILRKYVEEFEVSLKSDRNNGYLTWTPVYVYNNILWILHRTSNISDKIHILYWVTFFRKTCRLCDNVEKYGGARQATYDNIIRRMRFACWIIKATHTLRICNTYCSSTATVVTRTRVNITLYVHCLSCWYSLTLSNMESTAMIFRSSLFTSQ